MEGEGPGRLATGPHVINFLYDNDLGCDLDVLCHGVRFHIKVELDRLKEKGDKVVTLHSEYNKLIEAVRMEDKHEDSLYQTGSDSGAGHDDGQEHDTQPGPLSSPTSESDVDPSSSPATSTSNNEAIIANAADERDGKVEGELQEEHADKTQSEGKGQDEDDPRPALQHWLWAPFKQKFRDLAPESQLPERPSLHQYYNGEIHFFSLEVEDNKLVPIELESNQALLEAVRKLVPRMQVPKYIREMKVPWISSHDVNVLAESDDPAPLHPAKVEVNGDARFIKLVDADQPNIIKRELNMFAKIEKLGLRGQIKVPQLLGLVGYGDSKIEIMGFLLENIGDTIPLTKKFDTDVPQELRDRWAQESQDMLEALHQHGLTWGDAKGDNFLVDSKDDLWMIDFGGSYTEGWIEPDLRETKEGDDQGLERIVAGLEDPVANTYDPGGYAESVDRASPSKRRRNDSPGEERAAKRR